jgi:hypothetical protein
VTMIDGRRPTCHRLTCTANGPARPGPKVCPCNWSKSLIEHHSAEILNADPALAELLGRLLELMP